MFDVAISLANEPGALAQLGEVLGRADISIEGGGVFVCGAKGLAHFLFADGDAARNALQAAGLAAAAPREVLRTALRQDQPGQLGALTRRLAAAGVNLEVMYSDHANRLILVPDDLTRGREVVQAWAQEG